MHKLLLILLLTPITTTASELRVEAGAYKTISNRFNIPNPGGSRVSLKDHNANFYTRIQAKFSITENGDLRILIAPLQAKYNYSSNENLIFNGTTFNANTPLQITYKFNSYRFGYVYRFLKKEKLELSMGAIGKIRHAKIAVSDHFITKEYNNIGFVPLLNFGLRFVVFQPFEIRFDIDGAAAKQGRAFDGYLEAFYRLKDNGTGLSTGIRVLEGGADNKKVNTFALLQYAFMALTLNF